ncbi:N-acylneuraminate cytidylyltransferase A [Centruroides vittatus]|uniref:N-acylneuraminate cytidylyltransferase A n=1 Tax=Centruroides vittatus TaxID=120091 RepID=UPI003510B267
MSNLNDIHTAGLVLARGGSKGIPKKNVRLLSGIPLLVWVLRPMIDCKKFQSIWVSTDDDDIAQIATSWNVQIHYRSKKVAKDTSSSLESVQEFLNYHPEIGIIALIQCTSPCLHPSFLTIAYEMMINFSYDSVFSVMRQHKLQWKEVEFGNSTYPVNFDASHRPRRQDWCGELMESGHFYFSSVDLIKKGLFQGGKCGYVEIPKEMCIEIDSESDWKIAERQVQLYGYKGVGSKL